MMDSCANATVSNSTYACGPPVWYDPPCNSGNGGPCPSDKESGTFFQNEFLNRTTVLETMPSNTEFYTHFQTIADELLQTMLTGETSKEFISKFPSLQHEKQNGHHTNQQ